LNAFQIDNYFV